MHDIKAMDRSHPIQQPLQTMTGAPHLLAALHKVVRARPLVGRNEVWVKHARQRLHVTHVRRQLPLQLKIYHLHVGIKTAVLVSCKCARLKTKCDAVHFLTYTSEAICRHG